MADYADQAWPDEVPRFKNNEANQKKLEKLVARITPECSLPFFPSKGIKQHIIDHFHEKRRYRDNLKRGHSFTAESGSVSCACIPTDLQLTIQLHYCRYKRNIKRDQALVLTLLEFKVNTLS